MRKDEKIGVPIKHEETKVDISPEDAERAVRWAIICKLNPGGLTGDARKINKQTLPFEGQ